MSRTAALGRERVTAVGVRAARYRTVMTGLGVAFVAAFLVGVAFGTVWISPWDTIRLIGWKLHLIARPHAVSYATEAILFQLRLPRVLLAVLVGAGLATAGTLFQGLFRQPGCRPA